MVFGLASAATAEKLNAGLLRPGSESKCGLTMTALCLAVPLSNGPATLTEGLMVVWWWNNMFLNPLLMKHRG